MHSRLPGSSTVQGTRGPHAVSLHGCLFGSAACHSSESRYSTIHLPSTLRAVRECSLRRAVSDRSAEALRASLDPDFPMGSGINPFSRDRGHVFAFRMENDAGIEPAPPDGESDVQPMNQSLGLPFCKTCMSGGSAAFWATECHTPPACPVATGHTVFATWVDSLRQPAPLNCNRALSR